MASLLVSRSPHCSSCIRRMSGIGESLRAPASQQIRGKKKVAKATTINVKLRANIAGFGRKGSIVPVPPGVMRNSWFPRKMAEYQTLAQLKELGDVVVERDSTFNPREMERLYREKKEARRQETFTTPEIEETEDTQDTQGIPVTPIEAAHIEPGPPIEPELLNPEQAATIIAKLVPANIDFYRTPKPVLPPPKRVSPSLAANSALSAAAAAAAMETADRDSNRIPQKSTKTGIYGSVSTADIAANLKAILWKDIDGARVTVSPGDISFVEQLEDEDRVNHLGIFTFDIRLGPSEKIRRTITVKAQS